MKDGECSLKKVIAHVDMNAFFASVEQKQNPHLRGKPVLVCGNPDGRSVVATSSYEARAYGVKTGMTLWEARRLCPNAILVQGDPDKYIYTSMELLSIFKSFTPRVEAFSVDEAFLDLTGTQRLFGSPLEVARKIKKRIKTKLGLLCSVGIASNKLLAKLGSDMRKPDGLFCISDEEVPGLFEKLPVSSLCGIGSRLSYHLEKLGIRTCGDLGRYPAEVLERKFGKVGLYLSNMGKGIGTQEVLYYYQSEPIKSVGHSHTLNEDTHSLDSMERLVFQLSEQVGKRLRHYGYKGKTVCLTLRYSDFSTFSKRRTSRRFIWDGRDIYREAMRIFEVLYNGFGGIRLAGVSVSNLREQTAQLSLFPEEQGKEVLLKTIDQINRRYGDFTISWARLSEREGGAGVISPSWRPTKTLASPY
jgi:DNA polymerase-4